MKRLLPLLIIPSLLCTSCLRKQLTNLQLENEALKAELAKYKKNPFLSLNDALEQEQTYPEHPEYTREELHKKLLPQIQKQSKEKYSKALEIIAKTDEFLNYIDGLKNELITRSGGRDGTNAPVGAKNKEIAARMMIDEGKGQELKRKINEYSHYYMDMLINDETYAKHITLHSVDEDLPKSHGKSWEEYHFQQMPLAATLPKLSFYANQAEASEITILQYLNEPW